MSNSLAALGIVSLASYLCLSYKNAQVSLVINFAWNCMKLHSASLSLCSVCVLSFLSLKSNETTSNTSLGWTRTPNLQNYPETVNSMFWTIRPPCSKQFNTFLNFCTLMYGLSTNFQLAVNTAIMIVPWVHWLYKANVYNFCCFYKKNILLFVFENQHFISTEMILWNKSHQFPQNSLEGPVCL